MHSGRESHTSTLLKFLRAYLLVLIDFKSLLVENMKRKDVKNLRRFAMISTALARERLSKCQEVSCESRLREAMAEFFWHFASFCLPALDSVPKVSSELKMKPRYANFSDASLLTLASTRRCASVS